MLPYLVFLLASLVCTSTIIPPKAQKYALLYCAFSYALLMGIRNGVGGDWYAYQRMYETIQVSWWSKEHIEPAYFWFNWWTKELDIGFPFVMGTMAFFSYYSIAKVSLTFSRLPFLSMLIAFSTGMLFEHLNGVRQGMAISICFLSVIPFIQKKYFNFAFLIVVAFLFHRSSILFLIIILLSGIQFPRLVLFLIVLLGLFFTYNGTLVHKLFGMTVGLLPVPKVYQHLLYNESVLRQTTSLGLRGLVEALISFGLIYYYPHRNTRNENEGVQKNNGTLLFVNLFIVFTALNGALMHLRGVSRILRYFTIFQIVAVPLLFLLIKNKKARILVAIILTFYYLFLFMRFISADPHHIIPYKWLY